MTKQEYKELLKSDLLRYTDDTSFKGRFITYRMKPGYAWSYWYRKVSYKAEHKGLGLSYMIARLRYHNVCVKYGYDIPSHLKHLGKSFMIDHFSCIIIHTDVSIGDNCTIRHGVTLGTNGRGVPTIGNNVDIGAGAFVLGPVNIGDNAVIGAGAVVTHDVPANAVVAGNPAKVIRIKNE